MKDFFISDDFVNSHKKSNKKTNCLKCFNTCLLFSILMVNLIALILFVSCLLVVYDKGNELYEKTNPFISTFKHDIENIYEKVIPILDSVKPTIKIFLNETTTLYNKINPILDKIGPVIAKMKIQ